VRLPHHSLAALAAFPLVLAACGDKAHPSPPDAAVDAALPPPTAPSTLAPPPTATASAASSSATDAPHDALTQASQKYEPGPSVIASDSVDGAALRKRHIERLKRDTSPVTLLRGTAPLELGKRICEAVVPKRPAATPVLLKPNLCGFDSIKDPEKSGGDNGVTGRTTDVDFTRGVIQCLKARGHKAITIAEGCGHSHKFFLQVAELTGYDAMAREEGVRLVALDDDGVFDVEGDKPGKPLAVRGMEKSHVPTLLVPKILAEHLDRGLFLSLPKIKAHRYSVVSLGIKGTQGVVMLSDKSPAYKQKWRMHKELGEYLKTKKESEDRKLYVDSLLAFSNRVVDVFEVATPDAILADGAPAMAGDGFQSLVPSPEKVAIGGTNPVLVDKVGAAYLGLYDNKDLRLELRGHATSPLIEVAARRYKLDLDAVRVEGDGKTLLDVPRPVHFKAMAPFRIDWEPAVVKKPSLTGAPLKVSAPAAASTNPRDPHAASMSAPPTGRPEAEAASLGADTIAIDGRGDDLAWRRAKVISWDTDYAGTSTGVRTKARFVWSREALYALFELEGAGLHTDTARPITVEREGLYKEDCIEIFFTPDPARRNHYYEIEIGPFGHYFDLEIDRDAKKSLTAWSSKPTIATRRDKAARTAVIEVKLAAGELVAAMMPGARLPLGLYRMEGLPERRYLAWSPPRTKKPNFHVPEAFGTLVLGP